jgi:hypothetical protein
MKTIIYLMRHCLGKYRYTYPLLRLSKFRKNMLNDDTQVCIEGFPRSANSFLLHYVLGSNSGLKVAHHVHVMQQIKNSLKRGIPCIVPIREPVETLLSLLVIDENLAINAAIWSYIDFYKDLEPYLDKCVLTDFHVSTKYPHLVLQAVNHKHHLNFEATALTRLRENDIFNDLQNHSLKSRQKQHQIGIPSDRKNSLKEKIRLSVENHVKIEEAKKLYLNAKSHAIDFTE